MKNAHIPADWRVVKVDWTGYCGETWRKEKKIESVGIFYLIDANLHVHICSFTPNLEAWPLIPFATFTEEHEDDGETAQEVETEMMNSEEGVSYFGTDVLDNCPHKPATDYINIPEQEEDEPHEKYRARVADEVREYLQGNPCWF